MSHATFIPSQTYPQPAQAIGTQLPASSSAPMPSQTYPQPAQAIGTQLPASSSAPMLSQTYPQPAQAIGTQLPASSSAPMPSQTYPQPAQTIGPQLPASFSAPMPSQTYPQPAQAIGTQLPASSSAPMHASGDWQMQRGMNASSPAAFQSAMPQHCGTSSFTTGYAPNAHDRFADIRQSNSSDSTSLERVEKGTADPSPTVDPNPNEHLAGRPQFNSSNQTSREGVDNSTADPSSTSDPSQKEMPSQSPRNSTDADLRWDKDMILSMPVVKLCRSTGNVLDTFDTAEEARKSVSDSKQWRTFVKVLLAEGTTDNGPHFFKGFNWKLKGYKYTLASGGAIVLQKESESAMEVENDVDLPQTRASNKRGISDALSINDDEAYEQDEVDDSESGTPRKRRRANDIINTTMVTPNNWSTEPAPGTSCHAEVSNQPSSQSFPSILSGPSLSAPASSSAERQYSVSVIKTTHGFLVNVAIEDGSAVFCGYRRTPEGRKGPTEAADLFRNVEDKIVAVDGVCTRSGMTTEGFLELMQNAGQKGYVKFDLVEFCDSASY
jgi:hypothetical protein